MSTIPNIPEMHDIEITNNDVKEILDGLDVTKSSGPDGIPALILKKYSSLFAPILGKIFRQSYEEGLVPSQMKMADITPLHKSGDKTLPRNYRPVSLTPIIAKVFEKIIKKHIESHIEQHLVLSSKQHGFRGAISDFS